MSRRTAFSLFVRDQNREDHLLSKSEIRQRENLKTLMPKKESRPAQIDDLVAFLKKPEVPEPDLSVWNPAPDFNVTFGRPAQRRLPSRRTGSTTGATSTARTSAAQFDHARQRGRSCTAQWTFQFGGSNVEVTPLVVNGMMFVTGPRDNAAALDARTGTPIWRYRRPLPDYHANCTVSTNRGFAVLGDRLYLGTLDAHLVALDAKTGRVVFDVAVDEYKKGFSITHAPLVVGDKIIVGVTAGECALYGFLDAYDAKTGKRLWRMQSIAQPGDPARATWAGNSAEFGGGPTWMTGYIRCRNRHHFLGHREPVARLQRRGARGR